MVTTAFNLSRTAAAAFALGGVILMMVQPTPSWSGVVNGLFCLLMYVGFSVAAWLMTATRPTVNSDALTTAILERVTQAPAISKPVIQAPGISNPITDDTAEVRKLTPSQLPEFGKHLERRRWRGRHKTGSTGPV